MALFNIFGRKGKTQNDRGMPYTLSLEWIPYKLYSGRKSSSTLFLKVKNITNDDILTSVSVELPPKLSFDSIGMVKGKELKLGDIKPGEEREQKIDVTNSLDATKGEYTVTITATAHYRDYEHVMNSMSKRTSIHVV